jgi:hypothetical protein
MGLVPLQGPINDDMLPSHRRLTIAEAVVTLFRNPQGDHLTIVFLKEYPTTGLPSFNAKYRNTVQ